jgi:filamentous hemagglutinin family protein
MRIRRAVTARASLSGFCPSGRQRLAHLISAALLVTLGANPALADPPRGAFPRPCLGGSCSGSGGPSGWISYGEANAPYINGNTMTIEQLSDKAILNWESFDIGADNRVDFVQPDTTSVALNRVWAGASPTKIFGALTANGQVYIVNRNGVLFGPEARVNVGSLIATSLDIEDETFINGLTSKSNITGTAGAVFSGSDSGVIVDELGEPLLFVAGENGAPGRFKADADGLPLRDDEGNLIPDANGILVEDPAGVPLSIVSVEEGAIIETASGGRVILAGGNVENNGVIRTPGGQTILAAGNRLYMAIDEDLHGLLVEVDLDAVSDEDLAKMLAGEADLPVGKVTNRGTIEAERGTISIAGLAINQEGVLNATTAVNTNGIIQLVARDSGGAGRNRGGKVSFADGSLTQVGLDTETADETALDEQEQLPSTIKVMGREIELLSGSELVAPSGEVILEAEGQVLDHLVAEEDVGITIESGSRIDVSGATVELAMERNVVEVELRGNELADSPLQRDGVLAGQKVKVDIRTVDENGEIPIANVSNAVAGIGRTVAERNTEGGEVSIVSSGRIEFEEGAEIDVSGGAIEYQDGQISTTKLTANGQVFDISEADPNLTYDAILGNVVRESEKWSQTRSWHSFGGLGSGGHFEAGYVEGKDAGRVTFNAFSQILAGDLKGERRVGRYQRTAARLPAGGELIIGDATGGVTSNGEHYVTSDVLIATQAFIEELKLTGLVPDGVLLLDAGLLDQGGMDRLGIYSNGRVSLNEETRLSLSEFTIRSAQIDIRSDIEAGGGSIDLQTQVIDSSAQGYRDEVQQITLADDITLSTRGLWVNDRSGAIRREGAAPDLSAPALIDGGDIAIGLSGSGELVIGNDVTFDVGGGAWLQGDGDLKAGRGGEIAIATQADARFDFLVELGEGLDLRGYALEQGGTLSLQLPEILITSAQGDLAWTATQRNHLGALSETERTALAQQALAGWQLEQAGGDSVDDARLSSLLALVGSSLTNDGSQTQVQQLALLEGAIDSVRLAIELQPEVFRQGGFSHYRIASGGGDLIVDADTEIGLKMQNLQLTPDYLTRASGSDMSEFSRVVFLPDHQRASVDLTLSVVTSPDLSVPLPNLIMQAGASVRTEPQAEVSLNSTGRLEVNGEIDAPAGRISLVSTLGAENEGVYNEDRGVFLGSSARLSAVGAVREQPNAEGLRQGEVLDGGRITLESRGGYVAVAEGAELDVSGTEALLDFTESDNLREESRHRVSRLIASSAGAINLSATEGIRLEGRLRGEANTLAGAAGGELTLSLRKDQLSKTVRNDRSKGFPQPVDPVSGLPLDWTVNVSTSMSADPEGAGQGAAFLNTAALAEGFDALTLVSDGQIRFLGDVDLRLDRSLTLLTPQLVLKPETAAGSSQVVLDAPYLSLGSSSEITFSDKTKVNGLTASGGASTLQVGDGNTHLLELIGRTVVQGASTTRLNSQGDIRLRSLLDEYSSTNYLSSGFHVSGLLALNAAQVYPTTLSRFTLSSADLPGESGSTPGRIVIESNGADTTSVLSAGGKLTLRASEIEQNGVLKAPLGEIELGSDNVTTQQVSFGEGSLTSTAADSALVPFGNTQADSAWFYNNFQVYNLGIKERTDTQDGSTFDAIPEQGILAHGQSVEIQEGAVIDARGGGDLVAYEFLPGPGGSEDVLTPANAQAEGSYAILPWLEGGYAPYDTHAFKDWQLEAGASIDILKSGGGLTAGTYALLPARYAMLPGAYLVTVESGYQDLTSRSASKLVDGTDLVAARFSQANTGIHDARTFGVSIREGGYARTRSEYSEPRLSDFLTTRSAFDEVAIPRLPADAGSLVIDAAEAITLQGTMRSDAAEGGRGAQLDLVATRLALVDALDAANTEEVQILADELNAFGAESILIGGQRSLEQDGVFIDVDAQGIRVASGVDLSVPELILVAGSELSDPSAGINIESGARLRGSGSLSGKASDLIVGRDEVKDEDGNSVQSPISGGGALLRISSAAQVSLQRGNSEAGDGSLTIAEGASVGADSAMLLDATGTSRIEGDLDIAGGSLNLGAELVSLGEAPSGTAGLVLSKVKLDALGLSELILNSGNIIDLYGDLSLGVDASGQQQLQRLVLNAPGLRSDGGDVTISAGRMLLTSPDEVTEGQVAEAGISGNLNLITRKVAEETGTLVIGSGEFAVSGFSRVAVDAEGGITSEGVGRLNLAAPTTLNTPLLSAGDGAQTTIDVDSAKLTLADRSSEAAISAGLGATLKLIAGEIEQAAEIHLPSGNLTLMARTGDITLGDRARLDLSGIVRRFDALLVDTWGGSLSLIAEDGNITSQAGSVIDVSGSADGSGADAGLVRVQALGSGDAGRVALNGSLLGTASLDSLQGSFIVDANQLGSSGTEGFSLLNQVLNSGGFSERREIRLRSGDIRIERGESNGVIAHQVALTADGEGARILVAGQVGQSAVTGGQVELNARGDLVLESGATILAAATSEGEEGGRVNLSSVEGRLALQAGSQVDVSGGSDGAGGRLNLRALRVDTDLDGVADSVAIEPIVGSVTGADQVKVEALAVERTEGDLVLDAAKLAALQSATQRFMDLHADNIATTLDSAGALPLTVVPGLELQSSGQMMLNTTWDLESWRYAGSPGVLTLRTAGDLRLNQSLTDGFRGGLLQRDDSWSYNLIAGADIASANRFATRSVESLATAEEGKLILAPAAVVRTGTGSINAVAGLDLELEAVSSVIYTAGVLAKDEEGVEIVPRTITPRPKSGSWRITWSDQGGDVNLKAGRDLLGQASERSPAYWLWRQGMEASRGRVRVVETQWAVDFDRYEHGAAAFGGGDLSLVAGRDIENLSAAIPTTGLQQTPGTDRSQIDVWGGGDMNLEAGRDLVGGVYLIGDGNADMRVGGSLLANEAQGAHAWLSLAKGTIDLRAGGNVNVETITQPTLFPRASDARPFGGAAYNHNSYFVDYDEGSEVDLISLGGDVVLQASGSLGSFFKDYSSTQLNNSARDESEALRILPASLKLISMKGGVEIPNQIVMLPASKSNLWLLADQAVKASHVIMSDYNVSFLPTGENPLDTIKPTYVELSTDVHAAEPLHADDSEPVYVVSLQQDIEGRFNLPKQSRFIAGKDVKNFSLTGQHVNQQDVTLVQAGRDITLSDITQQINISGPGRLDMVAGRNIDLGLSKGVTSLGNVTNSALPDGGADITLLAGVAEGIDMEAFIATYLIEREDYRDALTEYMRTLRSLPDMTDDEALDGFVAATVLEQRPLVLDVLFTELRESGRAAATGEGSYEPGYQAIESLFPADRDYAGDLLMYLSRVYTTDGGDINILVPGGLVNAGLAASTSVDKEPSELGVVAQRAGSVRALTDGDFIVNQSRIFTLLGGDILMWSSYGNIDAGRGAKSAISAPEPTLTFDTNGNAIYDFGGAIAGSGIRAITTQEDVVAGDTDLYAPVGIVDAGDAGIDAGGNLFIGAEQVVGADNISVGGVSVGVPVSSLGSLMAGLTGVGSLSSEAGSASEDAVSDAGKGSDTPIADAALSFLEVDILGFGASQGRGASGGRECTAASGADCGSASGS